MKPTLLQSRSFFALVGICIRDRETAVRTFQDFEPGVQLDFCRSACRFHLKAFFYYYLNEALPPSVLADFRESYQQNAALDLRLGCGEKSVYQLLQQEQIPYLRMKGAWLAPEVYPSPALRPRVDLDLLLPESEGTRAFQILRQAGWRASHEFIHAPGKHLPALNHSRYRMGLDLHTRLFDFPLPAELDNPEILYGKSYPVELQLLYILYHCLHHHRMENGMMALLDTAYILRLPDFSWTRYRETERLAGKTGWLDLMLQGFPELFAGCEALSGPELPAGLVRTFRHQMLQPSPVPRAEQSVSWNLAHPDRRSGRFLWEQLRKRSPSFIGRKYRLSPDSVKWQYLPYLFRQLAEDGWLVVGAFRHNLSSGLLRRRMKRQRELYQFIDAPETKNSTGQPST